MHGISAYNMAALAYESVSALLAFVAFRFVSGPQAAS
jgi:hypothetical protein